MKMIVRLLAFIMFVSSTFLFSETNEEKCNQQKEKEVCLNFTIDSKFACIWDNSDNNCKVDSENRADYRNKKKSFVFPIGDKKDK